MKNFKKQFKKGFTLVELVVVIAVIAILGAVSVVSYFAITENAKQSNDIGLVTQLNLALTSKEAVEGKNKTLYDAIQDVKEDGFLLEQITPTSDKYDILWSQEDDRFLLANQEGTIYSQNDKKYTINHTLWKLYDEVPENIAEAQTSIYLKSNVGIVSNSLEVKTGIDVGNNRNIKSIKYTGDKAVTIRTHNNDLEINNEAAVVDHYGFADNVTVTACAPSSYHEHGNITSNLKVIKGRVTLESTATVSRVTLAPATKEDINVEATTGAKVSAVVEETVGALEQANGITEKTGAISIENDNKYVASIGEKKFGTLSEAIGEANKMDSSTINLLKDSTNELTRWELSNRQVKINLNGFKLEWKVIENTEVYNRIELNEGSSLTLVGGKIKTTISSRASSILINNNSTLRVENVNLYSECSGLLLKGSNAFIDVFNSTITSHTWFAIGSNASAAENYNIKMRLKNSNFISAGNVNGGDQCDADDAGTAILINVPSNVEINDCYVEGGGKQAMIVRGGTVNATNCEFKSIVDKDESNINIIDKYNKGNWGEGNNVAVATITLGNYGNNLYNYPTVLKLDRCVVTSTGKLGAVNGSNMVPAIFMHAEDKNTVDLTVDSKTKITGKVYQIKDNKGVTVNGLESEITYLQNN